ncbi:MAG TPA: hypothetical protein VFN50_12085, partial [Acidimicrobiales bacterium]|nr:hypothetical protein [Acidimicrobiales bacterium]
MSGRPPRRDGLGDGGPGGRRLLPALGAGLVSATCGIGLLATSGWLITRAWLRPPVLLLSVAIGAVQAFAIGRGIARFVQRLRVHTLSLERLGALRLRLYDTVEPLVPAGLPRHGRGRVLSGFLADADLVAEGFAKKTTAFVEAGSSIVVGSVLATAVDPVAGAALLAAALAMV